MKNIENLLQIYEQLCSCTNPEEVETLKNSLNISNIQYKEVEKESDLNSKNNGGRKEFGIRNMGKSRMLSVANKSREVDNLIKQVKELAEMGKFGDDLTIEVHEEMQVQLPTRNLVGEKFESYMKEISDLLTKNEASTIGVWGMGGVGKTTLTRHLHNMMLTQPHIYGSVYWITVSKDCSIKKLQSDIAERIKEPISDKLDESQRAGLLAKALRRKEKFVVILDDMWSDFDLNEMGLGIPKGIRYRLIVTSRSKDVCSKMYCDNIIKMDPLSEKDAWTLFVRSFGREIPGDLTKISTDVFKECAGLPLGIITLAKSMIGCNDECEWRNVLDELRSSSGKINDMEEKVFNILRLSYERLKEWETKECLLYCATYPEDYRIEINELIWLFNDVRLLGRNVGMAKMFDKGLAILKKLERAALLSMVEGVVSLHDLIRDMSLQIAGSRFMVKAGTRLEGIPDEESWTDQLEVVSLMENEIVEISDSSPKCDKLTSLLLNRNPSLSMICDGFFKHLDRVKHLDLSYSNITTLPESISLLKNLTSLIVKVCMHLENLPSLAKLTSLERLDLFLTSIRQLPEGIGSLIKLRYLNLFNTEIRRISVGIIDKLVALQYLAINSIIEVKELNSLKNLEHLTVPFVDFANFSTFIEQMKIKGRLNSYIYVFGNASFVPIDLKSNQWSEKQMYLKRTPSFEDNRISYEDIMISLEDNRSSYEDIMSNLDEDIISSHDFVSDEVCNLREGKVPNVNQYNQLLKILFGNPNTSLKYSFFESHERETRVKLFCVNELQKYVQDIHLLYIDGIGDLRSLGDFVIDTMCNLQRQSKIEGEHKPFSNLNNLQIFHCGNMKKLFSLELLSNLQNIEEISVYFCDGLEELIESAADETTLGEIGHPQIFSLLKLRSIILLYLPNLKRFCSNDEVIRTPSLQSLRIKGCPKLKRIPLDVDNEHQQFPQKFEWGEEEWLKSVEWERKNG